MCMLSDAMTIHDTGIYSLRELRSIEAHLSKQVLVQRATLALTTAGLQSVRNAIRSRTQWPKPAAATEAQAARLASFGLMPPPLVSPIGHNVETPVRGMVV